jgi:hypothetical protein
VKGVGESAEGDAASAEGNAALRRSHITAR